MEITSKQQTWFKKYPAPADQLQNADKAKVYQGRTFKSKSILKKENNHTQVCLGPLGEWWVEDNHWLGLVPVKQDLPYEQQQDLIYLPGFPYRCHEDLDIADIERAALNYSMAMCVTYLKVNGITCCEDYFDLVTDCPSKYPRWFHKQVLSKLGYLSKFTKSIDEHQVKDEIKKGNPVIANIFYGGTCSAPVNANHYVVITGYSNDSWLVQDPIGFLDLYNGYWTETGAESGKNVLYSFDGFNPRLFANGGATGHCWLFLSKIKA